MKKKTNYKRIVITCVLLVAAALVFGYLNMDEMPPMDSSADVSVEVPVEDAKEPMNPTPAIIGGVAAMAVYYLFSLLIGAIKKRRKKDK